MVLDVTTGQSPVSGISLQLDKDELDLLSQAVKTALDSSFGPFTWNTQRKAWAYEFLGSVASARNDYGF